MGGESQEDGCKAELASGEQRAGSQPHQGSSSSPFNEDPARGQGMYVGVGGSGDMQTDVCKDVYTEQRDWRCGREGGQIVKIDVYAFFSMLI